MLTTFNMEYPSTSSHPLPPPPLPPPPPPPPSHHHNDNVVNMLNNEEDNRIHDSSSKSSPYTNNNNSDSTTTNNMKQQQQQTSDDSGRGESADGSPSSSSSSFSSSSSPLSSQSTLPTISTTSTSISTSVSTTSVSSSIDSINRGYKRSRKSSSSTKVFESQSYDYYDAMAGEEDEDEDDDDDDDDDDYGSGKRRKKGKKVKKSKKVRFNITTASAGAGSGAAAGATTTRKPRSTKTTTATTTTTTKKIIRGRTVSELATKVASMVGKPETTKKRRKRKAKLKCESFKHESGKKDGIKYVSPHRPVLPEMARVLDKEVKPDFFLLSKPCKVSLSSSSSNNVNDDVEGDDDDHNNDTKINDHTGDTSAVVVDSDAAVVDDGRIAVRPLPPEIWSKIFAYKMAQDGTNVSTLITLSQVYEEWRQVILTTPLLWQRLDLKGYRRFPFGSFKAFNQKQNLFNFVKELDLSEWRFDFAMKIIDMVLDGSGSGSGGSVAANELEILNLSGCNPIIPDILYQAVIKCRKLRSLNLSATTASENTGKKNILSVTSWRPLMEAIGQKLIELDISANKVPSFSGCFSILLQHCNALEVLDISHLVKVTGKQMEAPIDIVQLQTALPRLRVFRAANQQFRAHKNDHLVPGFPHLQECSIPSGGSIRMSEMERLGYCGGLDNAALEQLTKGADGLTVLDIRGQGAIVSRTLLHLPSWQLKQLLIANCGRIEDDSLEMVFAKWKNTLTDLDLSWIKSEQVINAALRKLCDIDSDTTPPLCTLQLRGSAVSFETLKLLMEKCPRLCSIDLQSCRGMPRGIKREFSGDELAQFKRDLLLDGKYD